MVLQGSKPVIYFCAPGTSALRVVYTVFPEGAKGSDFRQGTQVKIDRKAPIIAMASHPARKQPELEILRAAPPLLPSQIPLENTARPRVCVCRAGSQLVVLLGDGNVVGLTPHQKSLLSAWVVALGMSVRVPIILVSATFVEASSGIVFRWCVAVRRHVSMRALLEAFGFVCARHGSRPRKGSSAARRDNCGAPPPRPGQHNHSGRDRHWHRRGVGVFGSKVGPNVCLGLVVFAPRRLCICKRACGSCGFCCRIEPRILGKFVLPGGAAIIGAGLNAVCDCPPACGPPQRSMPCEACSAVAEQLASQRTVTWVLARTCALCRAWLLSWFLRATPAALLCRTRGACRATTALWRSTGSRWSRPLCRRLLHRRLRWTRRTCCCWLAAPGPAMVHPHKP
jgi:hypothetical protein